MNIHHFYTLLVTTIHSVILIIEGCDSLSPVVKYSLQGRRVRPGAQIKRPEGSGHCYVGSL